MEFIDIHPLDLGALLVEDESPVDVIIHKTPEGTTPTEYGKEYVEYRGKFYHQTVGVPVTSEYGKRIMKTMEAKREPAGHVPERE